MPIPPESIQVGRLALRQEEGNWNAYYAKKDTMEGAALLGSIKMALIVLNEKRKWAFMDLMRECVADLIEEETGTRPKWGGPERAPEHERSGKT